MVCRSLRGKVAWSSVINYVARQDGGMQCNSWVPLILGPFKALHPVQLGSWLGHVVKQLGNNQPLLTTSSKMHTFALL